jgi:starch synthase (maltosyl-transferring)
MGFDHVLSAPLFRPGGRGDIFLTGDHDKAHPGIGRSLNADDVIRDLAGACAEHGLKLLVDVILGSVAKDAVLARKHPRWFEASPSGEERIDPRAAHDADAARASFGDATAGRELATWWIERLLRLSDAGVAGFRCAAPHLVPRDVWRHIIASVRRAPPEPRFLAWTPGLSWKEIADLRGAGFDAAFSSLPWWDGRAGWLVEEDALLRGIGSVIACPEAPFGPRLARRFEGAPSLLPVYRHMLRRAAATGDGIMVPMGYEFAASEDMDPRQTGVDPLLTVHAGRNIDLASEIEEANALNNTLRKSGRSGGMRTLAEPEAPVTVLLRSAGSDAAEPTGAIIVAINADLEKARQLTIPMAPLPPAAGAAMIAGEVVSSDNDASTTLLAGEIRVLRAQATEPVKTRRPDLAPAKVLAARRLIIDNVTPTVDGGRFAAKRVVGEPIVVDADVFADGHEQLLVELLWRPANKDDWCRVPMMARGNDRWQASFLPQRIGRYEFAVEASIDAYGSLCRSLKIKRKAGEPLAQEVTEAQTLLERAQQGAGSSAGKIILAALSWLRTESVGDSVDLLLTRDLRDAMREAQSDQFLCRSKPAFPIEVERPQAGFGAWYELFPRSASNSLDRHGTLDDVINRLPALRDMGFDVLYLTPIHPIGTTNRKGKNNGLEAASDDVGSPYAIGSAEGGHDAIHPALGTIDDFRRLRAAAAEHSLELAVDFAIQCSPDHPWLEQHPEWFKWRPDGSVQYAENPPKKYEDIVNVDFYAADANPKLWEALRDVVLFWIDEGVRIFRVDNPHTKPLPFWEWLIGQIRSQHPDVIFLSEAFTRPKMMYRLAKAGFTQSYTYFTWRNTKKELTDYFEELTTTEPKEFFRPHLFVNTPDINPYFLQTSGRPGFLIRAALAATLSGLWGMYSGFETCEAAALPGREEYLDSEKYQIRARDYDAPGNIVAEISKLNRIRRRNPALQTHLGLRFYPAHSEQVICYGKPLPARGAMILVAVSLDPFHVQDVTIEVPLWEWNLADSASVAVQDLMNDTGFVWTGKLQRVRLDPGGLPFAIWRISPQVEA